MLSLTLFAFLLSLSSTSTKEYTFDFTPTSSLIIIALNLSFILPVTFLLTESKNFESCGQSRNVYLHKIFHKHFVLIS